VERGNSCVTSWTASAWAVNIRGVLETSSTALSVLRIVSSIHLLASYIFFSMFTLLKSALNFISSKFFLSMAKKSVLWITTWKNREVGSGFICIFIFVYHENTFFSCVLVTQSTYFSWPSYRGRENYTSHSFFRIPESALWIMNKTLKFRRRLKNPMFVHPDICFVLISATCATQVQCLKAPCDGVTCPAFPDAVCT